MFLEVFAVIWTFLPAECSVVVDSISQKGVFVSDYCPSTENCAEGSHVMCMYYNPNSIMGNRCNNPQNVSISSTLAEKLLDVSNSIRSALAMGKEKGKNEEYLPKAYGMFKLKWDKELATFAQVLANQCILRHDMCRATKKFPNPGQAVGLVRFTHPDWMPLVSSPEYETPGLSEAKLDYAVNQALRTWYNKKSDVTPEMVINFPDYHKAGSKGKLYLEMVHAEATHMGCGVSAYTQYSYNDNNAPHIYNSVQVVCNYSSRPRSGTAVYEVNPPSQVGYTIRCGCPPGFDEDEGCLCYESHVSLTPQTQCQKKACRPAVVLLPIFTVENAPAPSTNVGRNGLQMDRLREVNLSYDNITRENSLENMFNHIDDKFDVRDTTDVDNDILVSNLKHNSRVTERTRELQSGALNQRITEKPAISEEHVIMQKSYKTLKSKKSNEEHGNQDNTSAGNKGKPQLKGSTYTDSKHYSVKHRYFDKKHSPGKKNTNVPGIVHPDRKMKKSLRRSIFTRARTFVLPKALKALSKSGVDIKKDVVPRKDFSAAKSLANTYISKRRRKEVPFISPKTKLTNTNIFEDQTENAVSVPKNNVRIISSTSKSRVVNFNKYLKNKFHYDDFNVSNEPVRNIEIRASNEDNDNKLMKLLDNLEQEVKHIELDVNEKEIFDAKIRKIYGTVVGKSPDSLTVKINRNPPEPESVEDAVRTVAFAKYGESNRYTDDELNKKLDKRIYETEDRVKELHSRLYDQYETKISNIRSKPQINYEERDRISDREREIKLHETKIRPHIEEPRTINVYKKSDGDELKTRSIVYRDNIVKKERTNPYFEVKRDKNAYNTPREDNEFKSRSIYRNDIADKFNGKDYHTDRNTYTDEPKRSYRNDVLMKSRNIYDLDELKAKSDKTFTGKEVDYTELLSADRRKYYQNKLDNLDWKLHSVRWKHGADRENRELRPMRPNRPELRRQKEKRDNKINPAFYRPDHARVLHTY